jgi:hypothetical protein
MRIGILFIDPRQLGAVGDPFGRQFLPSVGWRTGHEQCLSDARSPSFSGKADHWTFGPLGASDSPVRPSDVSRVDRTVDRWLRTSLAHRTVRCSPDSLVIFSRCALGEFLRAKSLASGPAWAPDTVWCTPG